MSLELDYQAAPKQDCQYTFGLEPLRTDIYNLERKKMDTG